MLKKHKRNFTIPGFLLNSEQTFSLKNSLKKWLKEWASYIEEFMNNKLEPFLDVFLFDKIKYHFGLIRTILIGHSDQFLNYFTKKLFHYFTKS